MGSWLTSSNPPSHLLEVGKQTHEFFNCHVDAHGRKTYTLKPMDQYAAEHRTNEQPSKQYFKQTRLNDIIMEYSFSKKNAKQSDIDKGKLLQIVLKIRADDQKWLTGERLSTSWRVYSTWIRSSDGRPSKLLSTPSSLERSLLDLSR